jgi:hypothetical protein
MSYSVMNTQQLAQLQKLLSKRNDRRKKKKPKQSLDFKAVALELRHRYGSLTLALELVGLTKNAWAYRKSIGEFPVEDIPLIDYLMSNTLESLTGITVPDDYRDKSLRMSSTET